MTRKPITVYGLCLLCCSWSYHENLYQYPCPQVQAADVWFPVTIYDLISLYRSSLEVDISESVTVPVPVSIPVPVPVSVPMPVSVSMTVPFLFPLPLPLPVPLNIGNCVVPSW